MTNKCLARSNKSPHWANATKERDALPKTRFFASSVLGPLQMELHSMTVRILGVGVAALTLIALASAHAQQMLGADSLSNMVDTSGKMKPGLSATT